MGPLACTSLRELASRVRGACAYSLRSLLTKKDGKGVFVRWCLSGRWAKRYEGKAKNARDE